jgi:hypothetical protein
MRKYITFIFIIIFVFNISGYYLLFHILQDNIKNEIEIKKREGVKEKYLSLIIIPISKASDISWIETNKEFKYKGNMYDVVKKSIVKDKIYLYCINDTKEKQLIENYNKNHPSKTEKEKRERINISYQFLIPQVLIIHERISKKLKFTQDDFKYKSCFLLIPSPPPKFV